MRCNSAHKGVICALTLAVPILATAALAIGQTREPDRKAIVIGINCYDPEDVLRPECASLKAIPTDRSVTRPGASVGDWKYWRYRNLRGAVNDARMMTAVLRAQGFSIPDDAMLLDGHATAAAILKALRKYLLDDTVNARPGDVRFIYYSGHGNYVRNLAVKDANDPERYDETIVPADHWNGTADIRDKELSRIFTAASKRVKIIFFSDSCHSGSLARGPEGMAKTATSGSVDDLKAPKVTDAAPPDESRKNGLIMISASRRDQPALETDGVSDDPSDKEGGAHGAFTWAFRRALLGQPEAPLSRVFQRAAAFLAIDKPNQVPNLDGLRTNEVNLFGAPADGRTQVVVAQDVTGDNVRLRGGRAIGVYKGTELKSLVKGRPSVVIRVTEEEGIDFSRAQVVEHGDGDYRVRQGDNFQVDKWVIPSTAMLRVAIPPAMPASTLEAAAAEFGNLRAKLGSRWVEDETEKAATHYLRWSGTAWLLEKGDFEEGGADLGRTPTAAAIAAAVPAGGKLLVSLPPSEELTQLLPFGKPEDPRIVLVKTGSADYRLRGRLAEGQVTYAWIRPAAAAIEKNVDRKTMSLPLRTDWSDAGREPKQVAEFLTDKAHRLGKLREWQTLPAVGSTKPFPYRLEVRDAATGKVIDAARVTGGQRLKVFLKADLAALRAAGPITPRYTYVFGIDQYGKSSLIWPIQGQGNQNNLFPAPAPEGEKQPAAPLEIAVSGKEDYDVEVGDPYGNDTYFLLTSVQRIGNPDILEFAGVRTKGTDLSRGSGGPANPLEDLLFEVGSLSRAPIPRVPTDWNLEITIIHSEAPAK